MSCHDYLRDQTSANTYQIITFPLPAQCNVLGYATFHILEGMMKHGFLILAVNVSESKALKPVYVVLRTQLTLNA